jgi:hypothetical protein
MLKQNITMTKLTFILEKLDEYKPQPRKSKAKAKQTEPEEPKPEPVKQTFTYTYETLDDGEYLLTTPHIKFKTPTFNHELLKFFLKSVDRQYDCENLKIYIDETLIDVKDFFYDDCTVLLESAKHIVKE